MVRYKPWVYARKVDDAEISALVVVRCLRRWEEIASGVVESTSVGETPELIPGQCPFLKMHTTSLLLVLFRYMPLQPRNPLHRRSYRPSLKSNENGI